jgi:hypothetical protein
MDGGVVAVSARGGTRLAFSQFSGYDSADYYSFVASIRRSGLKAEVRVVDFSGSGMWSLSLFFQSLAAEWRGWEGEKVWESLEEHLTLRCTSDKKGHAYLTVRVGENKMGAEWSAEATLELDVMQRERLAAEVGRYFARSPKP